MFCRADFVILWCFANTHKYKFVYANYDGKRRKKNSIECATGHRVDENYTGKIEEKSEKEMRLRNGGGVVVSLCVRVSTYFFDKRHKIIIIIVKDRIGKSNALLTKARKKNEIIKINPFFQF